MCVECDKRKATTKRFLESTCLVCGIHSDDWYSVKDSVWVKEAGFTKGHCHVACLEEKIGRKLTPEDFKDFPINRLLFFGYAMRNATC